MCGVLKTASHSRCHMELHSKSVRFSRYSWNPEHCRLPGSPLSCCGPPQLPLPHVVSAIIAHTR